MTPALLVIVVPLFLAGVIGFFLPRLTRWIGWLCVAGAIPVGILGFSKGVVGGASCGEMMAGVCKLVAAGAGVLSVIAMVLLGFALLLGSAAGGSRARRKAREAAAKSSAPPADPPTTAGSSA